MFSLKDLEEQLLFCVTAGFLENPGCFVSSCQRWLRSNAAFASVRTNEPASNDSLPQPFTPPPRVDALTVEAEGDVDDPFLREGLQVRDPGALEVRRRGRVAHVDPADRLLGVEEIHGRGLLCGCGQQAVDGGAAQGGGLDVLGVGDQQDGQAVHRHWGADMTISVNLITCGSILHMFFIYETPLTSIRGL